MEHPKPVLRRTVPQQVRPEHMHIWATWAMLSPPGTLPPCGVRHGLRQFTFRELVLAHPSPTAIMVAVAYHPQPAPERVMLMPPNHKMTGVEGITITTHGPIETGAKIVIDGVEHTVL